MRRLSRPYLIPSESMEPTLHRCSTCVGDRIVVDKLGYRWLTATWRRHRAKGTAVVER